MRKFKINVNGTAYEVEVEEIGGVASAPAVAPVVTSAPVAAPKAAPASATTSVADGEQIKAPMPGNIWDVVVTVGQKVNEGDVVLILEAMKMENEIMAPCSGTVASIQVEKGATVESGQVLLVIA